MLWFLWIVVLICAVWVALGTLPAGTEGRIPLPYFIALIQFLWIPTLATALAALAMREYALACCAIGVGIASRIRQAGYWSRIASPKDLAAALKSRGRRGSHAATAGSSRDGAAKTAAMARALRDTEHETAQDVLDQQQSFSSAASFTVMTLNCRYGEADAKSIVGAVLARNVAVLALQEATDELVDALNSAGLDALLPYRQLGEGKDTDNGGFNGIWIRVEPKSSSPASVAISAADVPSITVPVDAMRDITFASAHPKSPMRGCAQWSAGIIGLGRLATDAARRDRDIAVVLGDLNSGIDHPSFRALLRSGFRDASLSQGRGPTPTFPRWTPWPRIELDHILATPGVAFRNVESFEIAGTDHLALVATLTV